MIHKEIDFNIGITNSSVLMPLSRYRNNGIINNGKAPAMEVTEKLKEERESILEKLKAAKEPGHKPPAWFGERNLE